MYLARFDGDIYELEPIAGRTLDEVLYRIMEIHGYGKKMNALPPTHTAHRYGYDAEDDSYYVPDVEDDKIEVWELDVENGKCKVVWGFWGWHWTMPEGLEQGKMPGHDKALYELAEY